MAKSTAKTERYNGSVKVDNDRVQRLRNRFLGTKNTINADEEHIRSVLAFIRPHKNVIDYELLPYHRYGLGKYEFLGRVYELDDFKSPTQELLVHLQAIIDESFGRATPTAPGA